VAAIIGMDAGTTASDLRRATGTGLHGSLRPEMMAARRHIRIGRLSPANFNAPGQIVISGEQYALNVAMVWL